jgi:simple sugar transport system permease protein
MMLLGAFGFLGAYYGSSVWVGYLCGIVAGMVTSLFMVVLCVWLGLDQIVVGIAITLAGEGITSVLYQSEYSTTEPRLGATPTNPIPLLDRIPILGKSINGSLPLFSQPLSSPASSLRFAWIFS